MRGWVRQVAMLVSALAAASRVGAQTSATGSVGATVRGAVFDSLLTGRPLADAEVWVEGSAMTTRTDARGRFAVAGLPAGVVRLEVTHASLSASGVGSVVREVVVPTGGIATVALSTPSGASVQRRLCGGALDDESGVLVGMVSGSDDRVPAGATVTAEWTALAASTRGLMRRAMRATTRADSAGRFALCGVARTAPLAVTVTTEGGSTAVGTTTLDGRAIGATRFALSEEAPASGTLRGVVRTVGGLPIADATVLVGSGMARTDSAGRFALPNEPRATGDSSATVRVRAVGFTPLSVRLPAAAGGATLAVRLDAAAPVLAPVRSVATGNDFGGFEARREAGLHGGQFITGDEIRQRNLPRLSQVLMATRGLRVQSRGLEIESYVVSSHRQEGSSPVRPAGCQVAVYVDGVLASMGTLSGIDELAQPDEIRGVEIYLGLAPIPELLRTSDGRCGAMLVWTKRSERRAAPSSTADSSSRP